MALLSARLPAAAAIACFKALTEHADALKASGDERTRAQIMADELFARLTGRSAAEGVDVEVQIVMTDASLFEGDPAAAILDGYGPMPAQSARDLLSRDEDRAKTETRAAAPSEATAPSTTDPTGLCPDGPRCTYFSCTLLHGTPLPGAGTVPKARTDDRAAPRAPATSPPATRAAGTSPLPCAPPSSAVTSTAGPPRAELPFATPTIASAGRTTAPPI